MPLVSPPHRHRTWCLLPALWLAAAVVWSTTTLSAQTVDITLLHTNDWHGQVQPRRRTVDGETKLVGGAVALARAIDEQRRHDPNAVLVSAGDWFQGTPEGMIPRGLLMIDMMNALGYRFACVGNHDFDLGEAELPKLGNRAKFPFLGSNIVDKTSGELLESVTDSAIIDVNGVRVGFAGLMTEDGADVIVKGAIPNVRFLNEIETARRIVGDLRRRGAEIVVFVNHVGPAHNVETAKAVDGIDVIIGGHHHSAVLPEGRAAGTTLVAQAKSNGMGLGVVHLTYDRAAKKIVTKSAKVVDLAYVPEARHPKVSTVLARYQDQIAKEIDGPLAFREEVTLTAALERDGTRDRSSAIGNWITDVMRTAAKADVAFQNKTGIRQDLAAGPVSVRDFFEVSPFGNTIVTMKLTANQIAELIALSLDSDQTRSGLEFSGLTVARPEGDGRPDAAALHLTIGGETLDLTKDGDRSFTVATNNFLAGGGDGYAPFASGTDVIDTGIKLRDAEIDAARRTRSLTPSTERRWKIRRRIIERSAVTSIFRGLLGLAALIGLAWLLSLHRRRTPWRLIIGAVALQLVLGFLLIKVPLLYSVFEALTDAINKLLSFSNEGATFVFGKVVTGPNNTPGLAFRALPTIIFFSCLMAVLYHLRVMHLLIWLLAKGLSRVLGVTGAESMAVAANVFVGQTEAPLVVRRFIPRLTKSELSSLMTGGFATVAGSVLAAYVSFYDQAGGSEYVPHLLIASVMSAPAAFAISKIIVPETETSETGSDMSLEFKPVAGNVLDAAATGVSEGLKLWLNVFAMLLAFVAIVALIDWPLTAIGDWLNIDGGLSISRIFGWIFAPVAWLMGVDGADAGRFGALLGTKIGLNEFLAYLQLQQEIVYVQDPEALAAAGHAAPMSQRSIFMATYALCGFANFASIGIQIGGISPLAPERRKDIIDLALRAMLGGALASWMTATIAGMFVS